MEAETVLNLLDTSWYELNFFKRKHKPSSLNSTEIPEKPLEVPADLPAIQTHLSPRAETLSSNYSVYPQRSDSASPNSVLQNPKLGTIFSGKELKGIYDFTPDTQKFSTPRAPRTASPLKGSSGNRRSKRGLSKSLSNLEFQELKGFMDLGFVFSEEDKDSGLASILPGLQRMKKLDDEKNKNLENINDGISNKAVGESSSERERPYLSEAWEALERKRKDLDFVSINWQVPNSNSEVDMKGYLKIWAHNVASTVK